MATGPQAINLPERYGTRRGADLRRDHEFAAQLGIEAGREQSHSLQGEAVEQDPIDRPAREPDGDRVGNVQQVGVPELAVDRSIVVLETPHGDRSGSQRAVRPGDRDPREREGAEPQPRKLRRDAHLSRPASDRPQAGRRHFRVDREGVEYDPFRPQAPRSARAADPTLLRASAGRPTCDPPAARGIRCGYPVSSRRIGLNRFTESILIDHSGANRPRWTLTSSSQPRT